MKERNSEAVEQRLRRRKIVELFIMNPHGLKR